MGNIGCRVDFLWKKHLPHKDGLTQDTYPNGESVHHLPSYPTSGSQTTQFSAGLPAASRVSHSRNAILLLKNTILLL